MNNSDLNNTPFLLSLAILNLDIQSPVLFLHLLINPHSKMINGNCELSIPTYSSTETQRMDIVGSYCSSLDQQMENQYDVTLTGMNNYQQNLADVKITMVINQEWKKGKASYKYIENEKWKSMDNVYLKIKMAKPHIVPSSVLDIPATPYLPGQIK